MRIALISDTHLSDCSPETLGNWHAARRAVEALKPDLTLHLGDITMDAPSEPRELAFAQRLLQQWPTEMRCVPGNHDVGVGSGEEGLDLEARSAYLDAFLEDRWCLQHGEWNLLGIDAQLLGSNSPQEVELWHWLQARSARFSSGSQTALFLHRPLLQPPDSKVRARGRYVSQAAASRLLHGPLGPTLRLVVSGHMHQHMDEERGGVRHVWLPSTAFVIPDELQHRVGEKLVGLGLLHLDSPQARIDLICPDGMLRHQVGDVHARRRENAQAMPDIKRRPIPVHTGA